MDERKEENRGKRKRSENQELKLSRGLRFGENESEVERTSGRERGRE